MGYSLLKKTLNTMKKITLLLATIYSFMLVAQDKPKGKISFFSQDGVKFWVIIDGVKQNKEPLYAVNDIEVDFDYGRARIVFQDPKITPIDQTVQVTDVDGNICSVKYIIKKKKKGYDINSFNATYTVIWKNPNPTFNNDNNFNNNTNNQTNNNTTNNQTNNNQGVNQNTTVTTNDNGFNFNVNVNDNGTNTNVNTTTTTNNHANGIIVTNNTTPNTNNNSQNNTTNPTNNTTTVVTNNPVPGYTGRTGCANTTTDQNFRQIISSIKAKTFDSDKVSIAKQVLKINCFTVAQIKELLTLFTFENDKLDLAKLAYSRTFDYDNYYQINELFTFNSSVDDLNDYINNFKR